MKVVACIKCFNEQDYIYEAIKSVYDYVDKIYVIESCFEGMEKIVHPTRMREPGLSGDDTSISIDYMMRHQDPDDKITWEKLGFVNGDQTIIYNKFVDSVEVGDHIWMVDADEVYQEELARWIRFKIDTGSYHAFWLPNRLYWKDFYHRRTDPGWCRPHQRCYMKVAETCHYAERNLDVRWTDPSGNIYGFGIPPKASRFRGQEFNVFVGDGDVFAYHHYAYVRTEQRMLEKLVSQYIQNEEPLRADEYNHCRNFRDPIEFKIETHPWFTQEYPDDLVEVSLDEHPAIMTDNLWKDYRWTPGGTTIGYEAARAALGWEAPVHVSEVGI